MCIDRYSPRERVQTALSHISPDRVPVDFLAVPEVWNGLVEYFEIKPESLTEDNFYDPAWEMVLKRLKVDCRLISYDQFCNPPTAVVHANAYVNWWDSPNRSTPSRMWRQILPDGQSMDIWGHRMKLVQYDHGIYEELARYPLSDATSMTELANFNWPEPDWWDFSPLPYVLNLLDPQNKYHIRFRIGSIFETAWQLRGLQEFMLDLSLDPRLCKYIMDCITDVLIENLHRVLNISGNRIDMVYFYDDVATRDSLLISKTMWTQFIRPYHSKLIEIAKSYGLPVMYHCDGSVFSLIPELIDLGVDVLNPIQVDAKNMEPERLKEAFGDKLSFHGGMDIIQTLPQGTTSEVAIGVQDLISTLGRDGGYILASSHHIQSDTPLENILAMYQLSLRT